MSKQLFRFQSTHIDQLVTAEHKILIRNDRTGVLRTVSAGFLFDEKPLHWQVPLSGYLKTEGNNALTPDLLRLFAAIQADGSVVAHNNLVLRVAKQRKRERGKELLDRLKLRYTCTTRGFFIHSSNPEALLVSHVLGKEKLFGSWLLLCSQESLEAFIEEIPHWDGYVKNGQYFTIVRSNAEWVQTVAHLTGRRASIKTTIPPEDGWGKKPLHWVKISKRNNSSVVTLTRTKEQYSGKVYCPTVPSGFFLVRRNGKISVTGNSNYGLGYGMEADKFSLENNIPIDDAKLLVNLYRRRAYPGLLDYYKEIQTELKQNDRTLVNCYGRRIRLASAYGPSLFNQGYSFKPQSTVADIVIEAMCNFWEAKDLPELLPAVLALQVHDSIAVRYPESSLDLLPTFISTMLTERFLCPTLTIKKHTFTIPVDWKIGYNLGRMTKLTTPDLASIEQALLSLKNPLTQTGH